MQREIKFRAWLKDRKVMAEYISHLKHAPDCGVFEITVPFDESGLQTFRSLHSIDQFDLMQFTGLHDKNGKEIYEGDICRMVYEEDEGGGAVSLHKVRGKVYFDPHWGVKFDCRNHTQRTADTHWSDSESAVRDYRNVEIIGNIYENPELLGV